MKSLLFSIIGVPGILSSSVVLKKQIDGEWGLLTNESVSEQQQKNLPDIKNLLQHDEQLKKTAAKLPPAQQRDFRKIRNSFLNQKDGSIGELTAKQIPQDIWNHAASIGIDKSNIKHYADNIADDNLEPMIRALSADKQLSPIKQKQLVQHMKQLKKNTKEELENQVIQAEQKRKEELARLEQLQRQKEEEQRKKETAEKLEVQQQLNQKRLEQEQILKEQKRMEAETAKKIRDQQHKIQVVQRQMSLFKKYTTESLYPWDGIEQDVKQIHDELLRESNPYPPPTQDQANLGENTWFLLKQMGCTIDTYGVFVMNVRDLHKFARIYTPAANTFNHEAVRNKLQSYKDQHTR